MSSLVGSGVGGESPAPQAFLDFDARCLVGDIGAWGNNDGEEDNEEPAVDEGRGAHAEDVRA
jgi:hypothetical protein